MNTFYQSPGNDRHPDGGRRAGTRWYAAAGAVLLAAGLIGGVALAGHDAAPASRAMKAAATSPAAAAGPASTADPASSADPAAPAGSAGPAGQAAVLSAVLSSAASPAGISPAAAPGAAKHPAARRCVLMIRRLRIAGRQHAARVVRRHCRRAVRRRIGLRLLSGMYGQFTFRASAGTRTIAFERGTVVSADGNSVSVRAADGTTETWQLVSDTVVRRDGSKTGRSALASGEPVFVAGPVASGAHDIRLAVIRPAAPGAPSGSAAGS